MPGSASPEVIDEERHSGRRQWPHVPRKYRAGGIYDELPEAFNAWDISMVGSTRPINLRTVQEADVRMNPFERITAASRNQPTD